MGWGPAKSLDLRSSAPGGVLQEIQLGEKRCHDVKLRVFVSHFKKITKQEIAKQEEVQCLSPSWIRQPSLNGHFRFPSHGFTHMQGPRQGFDPIAVTVFGPSGSCHSAVETHTLLCKKIINFCFCSQLQQAQRYAKLLAGNARQSPGSALGAVQVWSCDEQIASLPPTVHGGFVPGDDIYFRTRMAFKMGNLNIMGILARHLQMRASAEVGAVRLQDQGRSSTTLNAYKLSLL
jgi:hypothetical protein